MPANYVNEVYRRLRRHLSGYEKEARGMFAITSPTVEQVTQLQSFSGNETYSNADKWVALLRSVRVER